MQKHDSRILPQSMLTRYALVTLLLITIIIIVTTAVYTYHHNQKSSVNSDIRIAQSIQYTSGLVRGHMWQSDFLLTSNLIQPVAELSGKTLFHLNEVESELALLTGMIHESETPEISLLLESLDRNVHAYRKANERLMDIRKSREALFPAMREIVDSMYPANTEFRTALLLALQVVDAPDEQLDSKLQSLRLYWERMISEFRVFMAFRTGTFGPAESGMPPYAENTETFFRSVEETLADMETDIAESENIFQLEPLYKRMLESSRSWHDSFQDVKRIQSSEDWRLDIPVLEKQIRPLSNGIQQKLNELDLYSTDLYRNAIVELDRVVIIMDLILVFLGIMVSAAVLFGYIYLRNNVLSPIVGMLHAMKAETGETNADREAPRGNEITNLSNAFVEMRSKIRDRETRLRHMLYHDTLTGLPNLRCFREYLKKTLQTSSEDNVSLAVVLIGYDRFKYINDYYGQKAGDEVLVHFSNHIRSVLELDYFVGRVGGDVFAVVMPDTGEEEARNLAIHLAGNLDRPVSIHQHELRIGASIGVAIYPAHANNDNDLFSRAELALSQAKRDRTVIAVYDTKRDLFGGGHIRVMEILRRAIDNDLLHLEYQPLAEMQSGNIVSFEVLSRCPELQQENVDTGQMIQLAEQTGLIHHLTEWLLSTALQQHKIWRSEGRDITLGINLSVASFHNPNLINLIKASIAAWDMDPARLKLEITETDIMGDPDRAGRILNELVAMGVRICIDDFGTGYSSLHYMKILPIHEIKIDQSYVQGMLSDDKDKAIVKTVISFAHNLGISVVAEGVETAECYKLLREADCDIVQGYYIARPMRAANVGTFLSVEDRQLHMPGPFPL